jgi:5-methylcytosine-specific restriction protein A
MQLPAHRCPSCSRLITSRCRHCYEQRRARFDRQRPTASDRGYLSPAWRELRARKLRKDPLCSQCLQRGTLVHATNVDHVQAHTGPSDPLFWQWSNLDSLCHQCHSRKTATQDSSFARSAR